MKYQKGESNMSFFAWLGLMFIVLKLCGVVAWSWWWVTAPLWIGIAIWVVLVVLAVLGGAGVLAVLGSVAVLETLFKKKRK